MEDTLMKARRVLLASFLLVALALVACGGAASPTAAPPTAAPQPTSAPPPTSAPQPTSAPATSAPAATSAPSGGVFKVAVILPSAANDLSFSQSMYDALVKEQTKLGKDKFQFVYTENMFNVPDAATAIRDYASKGYNLVIAHGSQYGASLADIAPDFPKTAFAWGTAVDTFSSKGIKNIFSYTVASDQGGYVEGVIAAKLSKSGVVGFIGPIPAGDGKLTTDGFQAGAKATNPNIQVRVTYTQSFSDVSLTSQAAQTMITSGADVLSGTSQSVVGAISVAKDKNVLWFGNDSDESSLAPNIVVGNQIYDWTIALDDMMTSINGGTLGNKVYILTLKNGGLKMLYNPSYNLPADVKALADTTVQGLIDGSIKTGVAQQ
jgi:basic membrane protein A and related proteins